MALDDIYKETILDHYKNPRNKRALPEAVVMCTRAKPAVRRRVTVAARVEDGKLLEVTFLGTGCSISQSSASMMTESVSGKTVDDALGLAADVRGMLAGEVDPDEDAFGDLVALKGS